MIKTQLRVHQTDTHLQVDLPDPRRIVVEDESGRKVNAILASTVKSKTSKSSKSARHHSLVNIHGFISSNTRDNRRPATLLKAREFLPNGRRRSPTSRSRTSRDRLQPPFLQTLTFLPGLRRTHPHPPKTFSAHFFFISRLCGYQQPAADRPDVDDQAPHHDLVDQDRFKMYMMPEMISPDNRSLD